MKQVQLFRIVIFIGAAALLIGGHELDITRGETFYERYVAVSLIFVLWASTFFSTRLCQHIEWVALACLLCALYIYCVYLYDTKLDPTVAVSCFSLVFVGCISIRKAPAVWVWSGVSVVSLWITTHLISHPMVAPTTFILGVAVVSIGTTVLVLSQVSSSRARDESLALSVAIFDQSIDALMHGEVGSATVSRINKSTERMFETDDCAVIRDCLRRSIRSHLSVTDESQRTRDSWQSSWSTDLELETAAGNHFWGNLSFVPLAGDSGRSLIRISDMSESKAREEQLDEARLAAEAAVMARTQFLANMSHEIRTPMNGVIGMTSLLQNTELSEEQHSYVETIRSSGESLLVIINEILDFAKIEAKEIELEVFPFDLERCVADAVDVVAPIAAQKGIELTLDILPEDIGMVASDGARLRQVLVNILSNAVKFTEQGDVVLRVRVIRPQSNADEADARIEFDIVDSGIGIPKHKIAQLFEPFTQADASTTRRFGGTGLGLSICKTLVELMNGTVSATSEVGRGSQFSFHILAPWTAAQAWQARSTLQGKRVLAVDDNGTNRKVLSGLLEWYGLRVSMFEDPHALIEAYTPADCDFILTDMSMPGLDGADLLDALERRFDSLPPVFLLTSLDRGDVDWQRFTHVLRKPVRPTDLFVALCDAIDPTFKKAEVTPQYDQLNQLQGQTVLVAEDNVVNQMVARQILKKIGLRVDIASDGAEAVKMLADQCYRLIFMDVQMPNIDGLEATQLIRGQDSIKQPYVVAMTANAMAEDRELCFESGMDDFVAKPVSLGDVRDALVRALDAGHLG